MSQKKQSRPVQMSFVGDSPANPFQSQEIKGRKMILDTSGQRCCELSRNKNPLGLLEKTLVDSSNWAWTKYSMKWRIKATPRGRLIYQLSRLAPPTNDNDYGSLDTWATPNTMDHLPPRDKEDCSSNQKNRKNRSRSGNLREQVVHQEMWPTPTTKGYGHASEGMTLIMRRKVEKGELTEKEAQEMMNGTTLRPPRMKEWMWPTPMSSDHLANNSETLEAWQKRAEKKKEEGVNLQFALRHAVQMFPTPTTQETEHKNIKLTKTGRRISKDGKNTHSLSLADTVQMWPTPRASNPGSRPNGKGGKILQEEVMIAEGLRQRGQKLLPTPTARDYKDRGKNTNYQKAKEKGRLAGAVGGTLNPTWVEWLMGYPIEYLSSVPWETPSSPKLHKK